MFWIWGLLKLNLFLLSGYIRGWWPLFVGFTLYRSFVLTYYSLILIFPKSHPPLILLLSMFLSPLSVFCIRYSVLCYPSLLQRLLSIPELLINHLQCANVIHGVSRWFYMCASNVSLESAYIMFVSGFPLNCSLMVECLPIQAVIETPREKKLHRDEMSSKYTHTKLLHMTERAFALWNATMVTLRISVYRVRSHRSRIR